MVREDVTESGQLLLRAISATKGRYGLNLPIEVLIGRKTARIKEQHFDNLEIHGMGKQRSEEYWKRVGSALIAERLVEARDTGKGFGRKGAKIQVYSVSTLGNKMLSGEYVCPLCTDIPVNSEHTVEENANAGIKTKKTKMSSARGKAKQRGRPRTNDALASFAESGNENTPPACPEEMQLPSSNLQRAGQGQTCATNICADVSPLRMPQPLEDVIANTDESMLVPQRGLQHQSVSGDLAGMQAAIASCLPRKLHDALMPFQRTGVCIALQRHGRILIGDDMGLGKTVQGISICAAYRQEWPALIIVPNSVRLMWADELERWIPDMGPHGINLVKSGQDLFGLSKGTASFHIVTYGILTRPSAVRDHLRSRQFKIVVVDESHMMKNRSAHRTKEILRATKHASRVILLSGTPALARPLELFTQVEAVQPGLLGSYSNFTQRYCDPKWTRFGMDFTGASNIEELHAVLQPVMVRRLKKDVLTELPSKRRQRVHVEISAEALATISAMKQESDALDEEQSRFEKRRLLMGMYKKSSEAKQDPVCEYVEDLINGGCKFLVFGHHLAMLDALEATAVRARVKHIRIDGSVNSAERMRRVNEFQSDESCRIAVLAVLAAGVGFTLTAASTVVFAELHWTPGILVQAEDRAHRIGQKSSVNIHYLIATGTIDDVIWPVVAHKVEVVSAICNGQKDKLIAPRLTSTGSAGVKPKSVQVLALASASGESEVAAQGDVPMGILEDELDDEGEGLLAAAERSMPQGAAQDVACTKNDVTKASAYSVLSLLQGKGPSRSNRWICESCSTRNEGDAKVCSTCTASRTETPRSEALPRRFPQVGVEDGHADIVDLIESASESDVDKPVPQSCYGFVVSHATGRVHMMDNSENPLGFNFKIDDWQMERGSGDFPKDLLDPTDRFVLEWKALKPTEHRQLVAQILHLPLRAALHAAQASTARTRKRNHSSMVADDKECADGRAQVGDLTVVAKPGLCAWCSGPLPPGTEEDCCSAACKEKDSVKINHSAIRWQLFAIERGVCQVCRLDAQALFDRVKAMEPPARHQEFLRVGIKATQAMLHKPLACNFWQADHIVPVSEGGGECDLSNFRTLCTTCHAKETKRLHGRLKSARWGKDSLDVRSCFNTAGVTIID